MEISKDISYFYYIGAKAAHCNHQTTHAGTTKTAVFTRSKTSDIHPSQTQLSLLLQPPTYYAKMSIYK